MTVLAGKTEIVKGFDPAEPRDERGRWTLIGAAIRAIEASFGQVVHHQEFGEQNSDHNTHGIMALHADGSISLTSIDEEGEPSTFLHQGHDFAWSELYDTLDSAAGDAAGDLEPGYGESYDFAEEHGAPLDVSFGAYHSGDRYVGIDTDDGGMSLDPENAEGFVAGLQELREIQRSHLGGDPSLTLPLSPDEALVRRKVLRDEYHDHEAVVALVSSPEGLSVRLGVISAGEGEAAKWTGGRGKTTVELDRDSATRVADILEGFEANGRERQKIFDKHIKAAVEREEAGEDVDWTEVDEEIGNELGGGFDDDFDSQAVQTPWGSIRLTDVGMDDEANAHDRHTRIEIWPAGLTQEQYDAGQEPTGGPDWAWPGSKVRYEKPSADLTAENMRLLIKLLRETYAGDAKMAKSARAVATKLDRDRIAREGRKYWTRSPEGLDKWVRSAHPWTSLYRHLATKMDPETARRLTSSYFKAVFGYAPSARQGKNPVGRG